MTRLSKEELKELLGRANGLCLTAYLPTEVAGRETLENPLRLKERIREADAKLEQARISDAQRNALLKPLEALVEDRDFWQHQDHGLAVFASDGFFRTCRLPYAVPAECFVGESFHVKPLLPLLADDREFFLLALSKNQVTLYRSSRFVIEPVPLEDLPQSEADALQYENPEKSLQAHTSQRVGRGEQAARVHGQGANKEDVKDRTLRFFRRIDQGLNPHLKNQQLPLLLAGVESHLPLYRQANTYPHLIDTIIPGNPEGVSIDDLRKAAWKALEPFVDADRAEAARAIEEGLNKDRASNELETAVTAACQGRAARTFVPLDTHCWGTWDAERARVERREQQPPHATDLLNLAAVQTLLHGGDVHPVDREKDVPGGGPIAVQLRF